MSVTDPVCGLEFDESLAIVHEYDEKKSVSDNLLPVLANQYNWQFMIPFGKKEDGSLG